MEKTQQIDQVIETFYKLFADKYHTRLIGGGKEPIYRPSDAVYPYHRIIFTKDYVSSALHEVAHWCIAGKSRRQLVDYGYWYEPDGRTEEQQNVFESVEVKPQAMEWIFSVAANVKFRVSADNLEQGIETSIAFKQAIHAQVRQYCNEGLPLRAQTFANALSQCFCKFDVMDTNLYDLNSL